MKIQKQKQNKEKKSANGNIASQCGTELYQTPRTGMTLLHDLSIDKSWEHLGGILLYKLLHPYQQSNVGIESKLQQRNSLYWTKWQALRVLFKQNGAWKVSTRGLSSRTVRLPWRAGKERMISFQDLNCKELEDPRAVRSDYMYPNQWPNIIWKQNLGQTFGM